MFTGNLFDASDPSTWTAPLPSFQRTILFSRLPVQQTPTIKGEKGNRFNPSQYNKIDPARAGGNSTRNWMMYSMSTNSLFCFSCCLFSPTIAKSCSSPWLNFGNNQKGFNDFENQARGIKSHERSDLHFQSTIAWMEYVKNEKSGKSLQLLAEFQTKKEFNHWRQVLHCILDAVMFLARNNLAFRGSSNNIDDHDSGNFLSLIKLLSKYSAPMALHVDRLIKNKTNYLSPIIQNEFISLAGTTVRKQILSNIRNRKYFSILFDATPDASHNEQISEIIRSVEVNDDGCEVEENFIRFIHFDGKTGLLLSQKILEVIEGDNLNMSFCRGQGYDNGSNMAGIYQGVQARIRENNPSAIFVPCAAHSLNLVGHNAATKVISAKLLLGQVQNLYVFFSGSPVRWTVLKKHVTKSLKGQSSTRWSSKDAAVSALFEEYDHVYEALSEIVASPDFNAQTCADAYSHILNIFNFKFLLGLTIWDFILSRIQVTNLALQSKTSDVQQAAKHLRGLIDWLTEFQEDGFNKSLIKAKDKAAAFDIDIQSGFDYRSTRGKRPARFTDGNESVSKFSNEEKFKHEFFDKIMEEIVKEMDARFNSIKQASDDFGFLWGELLDTITDKYAENCIKDLVIKYPDDFEGPSFLKEVGFLKSAVKPFLDKKLSDTSAMEILTTLTCNGLRHQFVNCCNAIKIFLTLPVSVASNERSFSKLKIIKNHLRSTMSQKRLMDLSILSIEHKCVEQMSFDKIIDEFAASKCRRVQL